MQNASTKQAMGVEDKTAGNQATANDGEETVTEGENKVCSDEKKATGGENKVSIDDNKGIGGENKAIGDEKKATGSDNKVIVDDNKGIGGENKVSGDEKKAKDHTIGGKKSEDEETYERLTIEKKLVPEKHKNWEIFKPPGVQDQYAFNREEHKFFVTGDSLKMSYF